jgi:hypothetical protein
MSDPTRAKTTPTPLGDPSTPDTPDGDEEGSRLIYARRKARAARYEEPYEIYEEDQTLHSFRPGRYPLEEIIAAALEDFHPGDPDKGIWQAGRLLVLFRRGDDGAAEVVRFGAAAVPVAGPTVAEVVAE